MPKQNLRLHLSSSSVEGGSITLRGGDLHHLRVRRLKAGDAVILFDDSGAEYTGTVRRIGADSAEVDVRATVEPLRESPLRLSLAQAVLKGDHLDLVIEKATEIGVCEFLLFDTERTVAQPSPARVERLRRVAESAAKQSGRLHVPVIREPVGFDEVLAPSALLFHPPADTRLTPALGPFAELRVVVGPEGGFSDREIERAMAARCHVVGLGPRVLRAETAGLVACALCQWIWGDLA